MPETVRRIVRGQDQTVGKILSTQIRLSVLRRDNRTDCTERFDDVGPKGSHSVGTPDEVSDSEDIYKSNNPIEISPRGRMWFVKIVRLCHRAFQYLVTGQDPGEPIISTDTCPLICLRCLQSKQSIIGIAAHRSLALCQTTLVIASTIMNNQDPISDAALLGNVYQ